MDNILELYNRILFRGLYPWAGEQNATQRYQQLLHEVQEVAYKMQPLYEVDFAKPVGQKRQYFVAVIHCEAVRFLNWLQGEMAAAFNECERAYIVHEVLDVLDRKLERVAWLIEEKGLHFDCVADTMECGNGDACLADAVYVMQFLKWQLIRLYMEVQDGFGAYIRRDEMDWEDLHAAYFKEVLPEQSFVIKAPALFFESGGVSFVGEAGEEFEPRMHDVRVPMLGVLGYEDIVADKVRFAGLERALFENGLIDGEHRFQSMVRGNIVKMAAVYRVALGKGYFHKYFFRGEEEV